MKARMAGARSVRIRQAGPLNVCQPIGSGVQPLAGVKSKATWSQELKIRNRCSALLWWIESQNE